MTSTVKWFNDERGYGFITNPKGGDDIFIHHSAIIHMIGRRSLKEGDRVTFELENGDKGAKAVKCFKES